MNRWRSCLMALCLAALAISVASSAHAAADCSVLAGRTYHCTQKSDLSSVIIDDDWTFTSNEDGKLSLRTILQADFRCTCLAKGNYKKPKFDTSLGFVCGGVTSAGPGTTSTGDAITGKVPGSGKKVDGQLLDVNAAGTDEARIIACTPKAPDPYVRVQTFIDHCVPFNYLELEADLPVATFYEAYQLCAATCSNDPSCVQMWVSYEPGSPRTGPFWCLTGGGPANETWDGSEIQCGYPPIGSYGEWYSRQP